MSVFILTFVMVWVCGLVISCFTLKFCLHSVCVHLSDQLITPEYLTPCFLLSLCPASGSCLSFKASLVCTFITFLCFHSSSVLVFVSGSSASSLFYKTHFLFRYLPVCLFMFQPERTDNAVHINTHKTRLESVLLEISSGFIPNAETQSSTVVSGSAAFSPNCNTTVISSNVTENKHVMWNNTYETCRNISAVERPAD